MLRVPEGYTITRRPEAAGTGIGIAGRFQPPFPPLWRGQDTAFSYLAHGCHADGFHAPLPFALLHDLAPARSFSLERYWTSMDKWMARDLVMWTLQEVAGNPLLSLSSAPEERLAMIAGVIEESAMRGLGAFEDEMRWRWCVHRGRHLSYMEQRLADPGEAREPWGSDYLEHVVRLRRTLRDASSRPFDIDDAPGRSAEAFRASWLAFASLLRAWPEILEAARQTHEEGKGCSVPLHDLF